MDIPCPQCTVWFPVTLAQPLVHCGLRIMLRPDGTPWLQKQRDWVDDARRREAGG